MSLTPRDGQSNRCVRPTRDAEDRKVPDMSIMVDNKQQPEWPDELEKGQDEKDRTGNQLR